MKRCCHVAAPLLAAAAVSILGGCRKPEMQRCVDEQNRVVADSFCKNSSQQPVRNSSGGFFYPYRYYYGGFGGYGLGSIATGGGYTGVSGHSYATSTTRGGFGSTHGGGSGGEGGGGE